MLSIRYGYRVPEGMKPYKSMHLRLRLFQITGFALIFFSITTFCVIWKSITSNFDYDLTENEDNDFGRECYESTAADKAKIEFLVDILDGDMTTDGNGIFLIQSTCIKDGLIQLNPRYVWFLYWFSLNRFFIQIFSNECFHFRQACAIESAALQNPDRQIYVIFIAPVGFAKNETEVPPVIKILQSYSNVNLRNLNISRFIDDPVVADWVFNDRRIFRGPFKPVQMSNLIRILLLYRYGGNYMDVDFVMQQPFESDESNFMAAEDGATIPNSVFRINPDDVGRAWGKMIIK